MKDFASLDSARETVAIFDQKIVQAEDETRRLVERLHAAGIGYKSQQVKDAWDRCADQIRPMRDARESLVKAMATIVGMTAPAPIVMDAHQQSPKSEQT